MMRYLFTVFVFILAFSAVSYSQDERESIKYTHEFRFVDGIFMNFEQVKQNAPLPKYKILTNADYHDPDFFDKVLSNEVLYYFDDNATRNEVLLEDIWGYSRNGVVYIRIGENFNRITILGGICHFVGTVTITDTRYSDPYYNRYNPYSYNYYNYYNNFYSPQRSTTYSRTEMKQFILDFETGKVMDYNTQNLEIALMRDTELYDEYAVLKSKERKQLKFLYIRKFNERNPIYFPK